MKRTVVRKWSAMLTNLNRFSLKYRYSTPLLVAMVFLFAVPASAEFKLIGKFKDALDTQLILMTDTDAVNEVDLGVTGGSDGKDSRAFTFYGLDEWKEFCSAWERARRTPKPEKLETEIEYYKDYAKHGQAWRVAVNADGDIVIGIYKSGNDFYFCLLESKDFAAFDRDVKKGTLYLKKGVSR